MRLRLKEMAQAFEQFETATRQRLESEQQAFEQFETATRQRLEFEQQAADQLGAVIRQRLESERQAADQLRRSIMGNLEAIAQFGEEIPKRIAAQRSQDEKSLALLAELGWFIDPNMPFIQLELLEKALSDPEEVVLSLVRFFRKRLNGIEQELKEAYPHRSHLFKDAFDAHRAGKYNLSIPVFLSQADGIWQERFSVNLFIERGRERVSKKYVSDFKNIPVVYLMHPFSISTSPLWIRKCANLSWKLKRLQTLWFDGIGRNNIKPVRERSRDEESVTFGEETQEEASTG